MFIGILPSPRPMIIDPSLSRAAAGMTGETFNSFTEKVRDHFVQGRNDDLKRLLTSHGVEACPETVRQVLQGRAFFFGDTMPIALWATKTLQSSNVSVRLQGIHDLRKIGDAQAVEALIVCLNDTPPSVAAEAAIALGWIRNRRAVSSLITALNSTGTALHSVRQMAAQALGEIGDPRAIVSLRSAVLTAERRQETHVAREAGRAIERILDPRRV